MRLRKAQIPSSKVSAHLTAHFINHMPLEADFCLQNNRQLPCHVRAVILQRKKSAVASQGSLEIPHHACKPADRALSSVTEGNAMQALLWAELRPSCAAEVLVHFGEAAL